MSEPSGDGDDLCAGAGGIGEGLHRHVGIAGEADADNGIVLPHPDDLLKQLALAGRSYQLYVFKHQVKIVMHESCQSRGAAVADDVDVFCIGDGHGGGFKAFPGGLLQGVLDLIHVEAQDFVQNVVAADPVLGYLDALDGAEQDCCNITINYDNAVEMMTRHFVEAHGFTKINYLGGEEEYPVSRIRREAYERVLRECGIPVEPSRELIGSFWDEPAYRAVLRYYSEQGEMPEAFVCANDEMAIGAVRALEQLGFRVPQDVCVSGLDGVSKALEG